MLGRGTDWRQGNVLTLDSAKALGLAHCDSETVRYVVITHDCDLANSNEISVDVIAADLVDLAQPNPQFGYCKNPRKIHILFHNSEHEIILELLHVNRATIEKNEFEEHAVKHEHITLPHDSKRALKQWLAARYGRPAFPDQFENHLRKRSGSKEVSRCIDRVLKPHSRYIVGLFFDLGETRGKELTDEPYTLSLYVVYDSVEGAIEASRSADQVVASLKVLFVNTYGSPDAATEIALEDCAAIADTTMSISDLRRVDQWRAEYISLNEEDGSDFFLQAGDIPA